MAASGIIAFALLGLVLGGALNAVAIRWDSRLLPVYPPSYTTDSTYKPKWYALIPLLALLHKNGSGPVGERIIWRYPLIDLLTALLFAYAACLIGWQLELLASLFFISILVIIVQTDITDRIIPNKVVLAGVIGAIAIRAATHPLPMIDYVVAAIAGSGFLLLVGIVGSWMLKKETMGGGDIKLYVFIGLLLGIKLTFLSLFLASLFGLIVGLALIAAGKQEIGKSIPFGPYIAAGALTSYFWGSRLIDWYLSLLAY